jgi:RimJ/RimL family protein N-acetyltransferase
VAERPGALRSARLDLVPGTVALYEAELASVDRLGEALHAHVPPGWPPGEYDRDAIEFFLSRVREEGDGAGVWFAWYVVLRGDLDTPDTLAGSIGYFGPPKDGTVEIGYSVVESFRGRGIASEAVAAVTARALALPGVLRVIAHSRPDNAPSLGVLRRAGFVDAGPGKPPGTRRFERPAPARIPRG